MGTITLTNPVSGTVITAGLHATNYSTIQTVINGNIEDVNIKAAAGIAQSKLAPIQIAHLTANASIGSGTGETQLTGMAEVDQANLGTIVSNTWRVDVAGTYLLIPSMLASNLGAGSNTRVTVRLNPAGANTILTEAYVDAGITNAGDDRWVGGLTFAQALAANDVLRLNGTNSEVTARSITGNLLVIRVGS